MKSRTTRSVLESEFCLWDISSESCTSTLYPRCGLNVAAKQITLI